MDIIFVMIAVSVVVAIVFLALFIKTVKSGQYDDLYTPSVRMLFEDEFIKKDTKVSSESKSINPSNNQ